MLFFLVTPCLVVAVQPCMGWIPIKKKKNDKHINQSYCSYNFVTLHNIQHIIGNRPLKGPTLGSADKYTTLLLLALPIKLVFHLQIFLVSNFFWSKQSRIQSYFLLLSNEKSHKKAILLYLISVQGSTVGIRCIHTYAYFC